MRVAVRRCARTVVQQPREIGRIRIGIAAIARDGLRRDGRRERRAPRGVVGVGVRACVCGQRVHERGEQRRMQARGGEGRDARGNRRIVRGGFRRAHDGGGQPRVRSNNERQGRGVEFTDRKDAERGLGSPRRRTQIRRPKYVPLRGCRAHT